MPLTSLGKAGDTLAAAYEAVVERRAHYGPPRDNYARLARLLTALLHDKLTAPLTPEDAVLCMDMVKTARLIQTPRHRDSIIDKAGYAEVYGQLGDAPEEVKDDGFVPARDEGPQP